jgi:threonine/homoserine/homoserine lactone efflux protein
MNCVESEPTTAQLLVVGCILVFAAFTWLLLCAVTAETIEEYLSGFFAQEIKKSKKFERALISLIRVTVVVFGVLVPFLAIRIMHHRV